VEGTHFLDGDGNPMYERHVVNKERGMNQTTLDEYIKKIQEHLTVVC
jgi:hypothetical protein